MKRKRKPTSKDLIPQEVIEKKILLIRGHKVMIDRDLALLYQVRTSHLTRQVRRNIERFPDDFMFQLTKKEFENLKCQFGTSSWGGTRKLPFAFTENGVAMLSNVLNSKTAIRVNIQIMRAFTRIREFLSTHKELADRLRELEQKIGKHEVAIQAIFKAIQQIMEPTEKPRKKIGF